MIESVSNDDRNKSNSKNLVPMVEQMGKVQDYFNTENGTLWDKWIELHLKGTDIVFPK